MQSDSHNQPDDNKCSHSDSNSFLTTILTQRWSDSARTSGCCGAGLDTASITHPPSVQVGVSLLKRLTSSPCASPKGSAGGQRKAQARVSFETLAAFLQGKGVKPKFNPVFSHHLFSFSLLRFYESLLLCPVVLLRSRNISPVLKVLDCCDGRTMKANTELFQPIRCCNVVR